MSGANTKSVFDEPDLHRTLGLKVENRTFWVSRESLAGYSPVFKAMLYGEFEGSKYFIIVSVRLIDFKIKEAKRNVISLPEKKADDIHELLSCLFPRPTIKPIDYDNVELILAFSDEYEIADLHQWAEKFLQADMKDRASGDEKLLFILRLGSKYQMKKLLLQCVKRCGVEFELGKLRPIFQDLRTEVIAGLLEYMAAAPTGLKCRFVCVSTTGMSSVLCWTHKSGCNRVDCIYCGCRLCAKCFADGKYQDRVCGVSLADTDKSVEALLNRM